MFLSLFLSVLTGYLLGSFPSGYVVGKCRGIDIRQHGSGNIGATNVVRTLGRKWGVLVFALDVLKGIIATQLILRYYVSPNLAIVAGFGCFLGHCFPVWLGFKGGKGVAVGAGILIGLTPLVAVIGLALWGIAFKATRYVSLASLIAAVSLPISCWALDRQIGALFWFTLVISLIAIWRHRSNIQRLLAGTESRFERKK
jgi:glycerol-3-phosphate acyltransferase PlsY